MGRDDRRKARDKNKQKLPQVPKAMKTSGPDTEFSQEIADQHAYKEMQKLFQVDKRDDKNQ